MKRLSISDTVKNITAGQLALLVLKGIQEFPSSSDKLKGTIDIWWIVHILLISKVKNFEFDIENIY